LYSGYQTVNSYLVSSHWNHVALYGTPWKSLQVLPLNEFSEF
jgi:hypothetical protein